MPPSSGSQAGAWERENEERRRFRVAGSGFQEDSRHGVFCSPRNLEPGTWNLEPLSCPCRLMTTGQPVATSRRLAPAALPPRHWPSPARIGPIGLIRPIRPIRLCDRQAPRLRPVPLQPINEFPPRKVRVRRKRKSESRSPRRGLKDLWREKWFRVAGSGFQEDSRHGVFSCPRNLEPGTWNRSRGLAPS